MSKNSGRFTILDLVDVQNCRLLTIWIYLTKPSARIRVADAQKLGMCFFVTLKLVTQTKEGDES